MRKLSEAEEDAHLEEHMIHEEQFHSVDYDVWIDDATGYKKIEKYLAYQHAEECPECGYFTLRIEREEIEKMPTQEETGLFLKHYVCSYCGHREVREQTLAKLSANVS
jgi:ribosomal protein L32